MSLTVKLKLFSMSDTLDKSCYPPLSYPRLLESQCIWLYCAQVFTTLHTGAFAMPWWCRVKCNLHWRQKMNGCNYPAIDGVRHSWEILVDPAAVCNTTVRCRTGESNELSERKLPFKQFQGILPTVALPKLAMFHAISLCCLARNCFPSNTNLRTTNQQTILNKTSMPQ